MYHVTCVHIHSHTFLPFIFISFFSIFFFFHFFVLVSFSLFPSFYFSSFWKFFEEIIHFISFRFECWPVHSVLVPIVVGILILFFPSSESSYLFFTLNSMFRNEHSFFFMVNFRGKIAWKLIRIEYKLKCSASTNDDSHIPLNAFNGGKSEVHMIKRKFM